MALKVRNSCWKYEFKLISRVIKKLRSNVDEKEQRKLIKELNIVMQCHDFSNVVKFYGVKFKNRDVCSFFNEIFIQ